MARRRSPRTTAITLAPRAPAAPRPAPIVIRTPAAPATRRSSPRRASTRRRSSPSSGGSVLPSFAASAAAGGVIGLIRGSELLQKIPRMPLIGRIGSVAVIAHFLAEHTGSRLARDVSRAAVTLAAYQLASAPSDKPFGERIDGPMGDDDLITV